MNLWPPTDCDVSSPSYNWCNMATNTSSLEITTMSPFPDNTSSMTTVQSSTKAADVQNAPTWDDATWILTSSFIIFTMQSGFGLLESGFAGCKNEVNVMAKNVADVIFGGISYWMFGYGLSFGTDPGTNAFCGVGRFFLNPDDSVMGEEYSRFVFQASFATTATTIVSGAMAERTKFTAYIIFSFFNTFVYCFPAHWMWAETGFLKNLDVVDVAGDGPVHVVGGTTALVAAIMIKPRVDRFTSQNNHRMGNPTNALLGTFMLWWGWLAFNCGSTYGISDGKWKIAARSAATTLMSASGGGITAFVASYIVNKRIFEIGYIVNGVLGALVSITAICAVTGTWESLIIGAIGALLACAADALLHRLHIDDPVAAFPVHGVCGAWGLLAPGFFAHEDTITMSFSKRNGLVRGGGFYLLGVQLLALLTLVAWSAFISFVFLKIIDLTVGLRLSLEDELLGADFVEHNIGSNRQMIEVKASDRVNNQNKIEPTKLENGVEERTKENDKPYSSQICLISYRANNEM
ncbi:putative ammonium transporter 3 [Haliotis rufescens]|uniref:putative ammonium transporter 3 n=1 Tax=Haliotis rufescens TaxID=6454 RepID=UPI001EB03C34|nr:putative ammonium transporter 3 [Haliotis rufescens]